MTLALAVCFVKVIIALFKGREAIAARSELRH
jgi:hypothetical protein